MGHDISRIEAQLSQGFTYSKDASLTVNQADSAASDIVTTQYFKPTTQPPNHKGAEQVSYLARSVRGNFPDPQAAMVVQQDDNRQHFPNTTEWPYSAYGLVLIDTGFPGLMYWGTGVLIEPNFVLTAASNVYDLENRRDYKTLTFIPALNGETAPFGEVRVTKTYCPEAYKRGNKAEDYALLTLEHPIGYKAGFFGLRVTKPELLEGQQVSIIGYAEDKVQETEYQLWGMSGPLEKTDAQYMFYNSIHTDGGQNGTGVVFKEGDAYHVTGVHVGPRRTVWISQFRYDQITTWIANAFSTTSAYRNKQQVTRFVYNDIGNTEMKVLVNQPLPNLREISLGTDVRGIGNKGAKILATNTTWTHLNILDISNNFIGAKGIAALAQNNTWTHLQRLDLEKNMIGRRGAAKLAANTSWTNLQVLRLDSNAIRSKGIASLASNTSWVNLQTLTLELNHIKDAAVSKLAANTSWVNLQKLDLKNNFISRKGAAALGANKSWRKLISLDLSDNLLGNRSVMLLAANTTWTELRILRLSHNFIRNKGAAAIGGNTAWIDLRTLDLTHNFVKAKGAAKIKANPTFGRLDSLLY